MLKVTVIIPVYNTEKYLKKCLDSVCNQTLKDIEIICVNDCSTDNSLEILEEYARFDNRIKIINFKENKGVAIARNLAIEQAKGEYIGFVDSDDFVAADFFEKLYNRAKKTNSDIVMGNILEIDKNNKKYDVYSFIRNKIKQNKLNFNGNFSTAIYKNQLLKDYKIKFTENLAYGEDRLLPLQAAYYSKNFQIVEDTYYYYFRRENSASKVFGDKQIKDFNRITTLIIDFMNKENFALENKKIVLESFVLQTLDLTIKTNTNYLKNLLDKMPGDILEYFYLNNLDLNKPEDEVIRQASSIFNKIKFRELRKNIQR